MTDVLVAALLGGLAGLLSGLLGIGGGAVFVPALVLLGLSQIEAIGTSLLAIVPVAVVGAWRQRHYGNLELREGLVLGALAVGGGVAGAVLANAVPERALEVAFGLLLVVVAGRLARRALVS